MIGSLRPRGPKTWQLTIDLGFDPTTGRRRRAFRTVHGTKKEAEARLARYAEELGRVDGEGYDQTVTQLVRRHLEQTVLAATTRDQYVRALGRIEADELGRRPLWKVEPYEVDALYGRLLNAGIGVDGVRRDRCYAVTA